jgi:peptide/nickel transport system permease protein
MVIDSLLALDGKLLVDALYHLVLPAFTLSMPGVATIARFTRSGFLGVMQTDYSLFAIHGASNILSFTNTLLEMPLWPP